MLPEIQGRDGNFRVPTRGSRIVTDAGPGEHLGDRAVRAYREAWEIDAEDAEPLWADGD